MKAVWNEQIIAESENTVVVEGSHYFPPESIHSEYFSPSDHTSVCPWKGNASYYNVVVNDKTNESAAWYYPTPKEAANHIKGYVAFWKGIEVI